VVNATTKPIVFISRVAGAHVGAHEDGSAWNGNVRFQWNAQDMVYRSEEFMVTLNAGIELQTFFRAGPHNATFAAVPVGFRVRIKAITTTRAYNGNCFLCRRGLTNDQLFVAADGTDAAPQFDVEVLDALPSGTLTTFSLVGTEAVRIMVGGNYSIAGPTRMGEADDPFLKRIRTGAYPQLVGTQLAEAWKEKLAEYVHADWSGAGGRRFNTFQKKFGGVAGGSFGDALALRLNDQEYFPVLQGPMNKDPGSPYADLDISVTDLQASLMLPYYTYVNFDTADDSMVNTNTHRIWRFGDLDQTNGASEYAKFASSLLGADNFFAGNQINIYGGLYAARTFNNTDFPYPPFYYSDAPAVDAITLVVNIHAKEQFRTLLENASAEPQVPPFYNHAALVIALAAADTAAAKELIRSKMLSRSSLYPFTGSTTFQPKFSGPGLNHDELNDAATSAQKMFCVPMNGDAHLNDAEFLVGWDDVEDEAEERQALTGVNRFHMFSDLNVQVAQDSREFSLRADVSSLMNATDVGHGTAAAVGRPGIDSTIFVTDLGIVRDNRGEDLDVGAEEPNPFPLADCTGFGNAFEVRIRDGLQDSDAHQSFAPVLIETGADGWVFQDMALNFTENRTFFVVFNDVGVEGQVANLFDPSVFYFETKDAETVFSCEHNAGNDPIVRVVTKVQMKDEAGAAVADLPAELRGGGAADNAHKDTCLLMQFGPKLQKMIGNERLLAILKESNRVGPVFQSQKRISQHLCAPVLNPNARIGCKAPLNYETMHLPPELRDFKLELRDVNFGFLPGASKLESLVLYEFNGGNQVVAGEPALLHLPQFREHTTTTISTDGKFDFEMFSPYGMPSYIALFCRDMDMSRDHLVQPLIKQLSIMCNTTMKKSNTILDANVHQLYHITQRNVNQRARYNRSTFDKRQVVLLSAEDVGMMGLDLQEYQNEKRALFRFHGTVDQIGRITAVLIYTNRGLHVYGKQLQVVRLGE
jgi:hypothetical protein